ncbi:DUF3105 domain-containing protein [Geodermatophilus sp. TF02-6]|uniref:DUF3105 domain-containing protein n=1 Tax=Geodermatophilus sp. TF02-6 TaxID=2250575 RepID=UPI000DE8B3FB|nr:DUF3105 domain-containing protein [Geodermatophilus sp. TF02-6]RBY81975.1 DUF3105 domain-containing protein [Geodermatophilus sp. TF02-6]
MAKDRKPQDGRARGGASRSGAGTALTGGRGGRTRPPVTNVVAPQRPWGLIAAAVAVVVFAAAVITYAVVKVNEADAGRITSPDQIAGVRSFDYSAGQQHVTTPVQYTESPPVGGPHDGEWADCTGTVYDVDIRHENAVHSLEHGAVWITYDPDRVSPDDVATLADLVEGEYGRMLSPYAGQDSPISLQSWNHQLKVDSVDDPRIVQFADFLTLNADVEGHYPEVGASCENPQFVSDPLTVGDPSRGTNSMTTDAPTTPTAGAGTSAP